MKIILALSFLLISCDSNVIDPNGVYNEDRLNSFNVKLKIINDSSFDLENVFSNSKDFGSVKLNKESKYKGFTAIRKYPQISAVVNGLVVEWKQDGPIDELSQHERGYFAIRVTDVQLVTNSITATISKVK